MLSSSARVLQTCAEYKNYCHSIFSFYSGSTPNQFYIFQKLIEENNFHVAYYTEISGAGAKPREAIRNLGYEVNIPQGFSPAFDAANSGKKYMDKI